MTRGISMNELLERVREKLKEIIPYEWEVVRKLYMSGGGSYRCVPVDKSLDVWEYYKKKGISMGDVSLAVEEAFEIYTSKIPLPDEDGYTNYVISIPFEGEIQVFKGKENTSDFAIVEWSKILWEKYFNVPSSDKKVMDKYHRLYDENGNRKPKRKKRAPKLILNGELEEWFKQLEENRSQIEPLFCGLQLLDESQMEEEWKSWRKLDDDISLNDSACFKSYPAGAIKRLYSYPKWIPIAHDESGNYIGVDLGADRHGKNGQVINFGRDEEDKYVFASSLSEFIDLLKEKKESFVDDIFFIDQLKQFVSF